MKTRPQQSAGYQVAIPTKGCREISALRVDRGRATQPVRFFGTFHIKLA